MDGGIKWNKMFFDMFFDQYIYTQDFRNARLVSYKFIPKDWDPEEGIYSNVVVVKFKSPSLEFANNDIARESLRLIFQYTDQNYENTDSDDNFWALRAISHKDWIEYK